MTEIRKSKQKNVVKGFGNWILEFAICLGFGAWNLNF